MELNDLKSGWQHAGDGHKTETDLKNMTKVMNHPSLKKVRTKLLIEVILMTLFLFLYYSGFDGDKKSLLVNLLLVSSVILILLNDLIGYISISRPAKGGNLKINIQNYLRRIKRLSVLSICFSFLYSVSLIVFFSASITFTPRKYLIVAGFISILFLSVYFSYRIWSKWIGNLKNLSVEMEEEA